MACLSSEQLKKIEANKTAAMLKKQKHTSNTLASCPNLPSTNNTSYFNNERNFLSKRLTNSTSNPSITASCRLISVDRFVIDMPYHEQSINILKSIPGRMYDATSKKWSFPLSSYNVLIQKLQSAGVSVSGIPTIVLNTFLSPNISYENIDLTRIDPILLNKLMPFQVDGVKFGISRKGRCLIADDMGLGKTIQALGIAHYFKENWPLLIVCPSSMRFPWEEAIQIFLPSVNPFYISVMTNGKDEINEAQIVICSYDLMKSCLDSLLKMKFGAFILDESHSLKNYKSARTKAALQLTQKCKNVILLSGTPVLSRPQELYSQIFAIDPFLFRSFHDFGVRYCDGKKDKFGWNYSGSSNMEELQLFLKMRIMIRRLKSEVITQLPSKLRKLVVLHPNMVKKITKQMKDFASQLEVQKGMEKRGTLLSYYCATGTAKLDAVLEYLQDKLENENKFLVFAHHSQVLNCISELLLKKGVDHIKIDGSTSSESRKLQCDKFQNEDKCRVAVLSIKAANSGLTLTAAQLVIFAELFWNPGELTQAEDRAHRIGQQDSVVVEYLVAKGTADEYLWSLVQSKLNILNQVGLSKDNFSEADTKHMSDRSQATIDSLFMAVEKENSADIQIEKLGFSSEGFEEEGDDVLANFNLENLETEYTVESKKKKI